MNLSSKQKVLIGLAVCTVMFTFGRYTAPTSLKESSKTSQTDVNKKVDEQDKETKKKTKTITKEVTKPDGTKEKSTTVIVDEDTKNKNKSSTVNSEKKTAESSKEVARGSSILTLSALAGTKIQFSGPLEPIYGGMASKQFIGPINLGVFGFNNGLAGVALGVSF